MEYLVTLKNPKTGHTRKARVSAGSTGQAISKIGKIPTGYGIDSVRKASDPEPVVEDIAIPDYEDPTPPPPPPPAYEQPPARRSEPNQYRSVTTGHSTGTLVLVWITGALIGAGTFWLPGMADKRAAQNNAPPLNAAAPAQSASTAALDQQADTSPPVAASPRNTTAASTITGTIWGLDQGEELPLAIYRVTGRDPQTRFLYEALVAADNENQAKERYQLWSPNLVVSVNRIAWLRGTPDGEQP